MKLTAVFVVALTCLGALADDSPRHALSFDDRVRAQEAVERVYYAHQIGITQPFERAVPRAVLEAKVQKYLDQTAALDAYWKTSVTDEALQRELERMARGTTMPERLLELYAALGNDPLLIRECLARPILTDRLARNAYAFDPALHAAARRQADELRQRLLSGALNMSADLPNRTVVDLVTNDQSDDSATPDRLTLRRFRARRADFPDRVGLVSPIKEERERFVFSVVLSESPLDARAAIYVIDKVTWDAWWELAKRPLQSDLTAAVASHPNVLPIPSSGLVAGVREVRPRAHAVPCAADDTWDGVSLDLVPSARSFHTAVWTGTEMVVWGGEDQNSYLNTGGRYDPATDNWTPISTTDAPSARSHHTAVWTGNLMLVRGGLSVTGDVNTGGRYDVLTDTWTPMSATGAPLGGTAVWTGRSMLVWAGYSGGRYDPAADTWSPMATAGAPTGGVGVWTGTLMVVWGGWPPGGHPVDPGTGGRYDPATDTWTPTSTNGAPVRRLLDTVVWTGKEVIVWGGFDGNGSISQGGRYDPATDTWTPVSSFGEPSARCFHGAVWTGNVMVVWGGRLGSLINRTNTGGRYDPVTDSWVATSTVGPPSKRYGHTAIWTGSSMVVWGGADEGALDSGGRYVVVASVDADGDGHRNCEGDCDDADPTVYPGAAQVCDGINNDCDDPAWPTAPPNEADADGDAFRVCDGDCDDADSTTHPGGLDLPGNASDEDCDGLKSCDPAAPWKSHGRFVECVAHEAERLVALGRLEVTAARDLIRNAAQSDTGKQRSSTSDRRSASRGAGN